MPESPQDHKTEAMLVRLGEEMARADSIAPEVMARLDAAPARVTRRSALWWTAGLAAVAAACVLAGWWLPRPAAPPPGPTPTRLRPLPRGTARVEAGGLAVTQHFATVVDSRGVLVLWSWRDKTRPTRPDPPAPSVGDRDGYTEHALTSGHDPDGTRWRWSLFLPEAGGGGSDRPPLLRVRDEGGRLVCLAAWPRPSEDETLRRTLAACLESGRPAPTMAQIKQIAHGPPR